MDLGISISENFDDLARLAKDDPEAFESYRESLIQKTIENAPLDRQTNLRRYQWRIDQETRRQDSSFGACVKLTQMMSQRMVSINDQLYLLAELTRIDTSALHNFNKRSVKSF